jgi:hypothetical protein
LVASAILTDTLQAITAQAKQGKLQPAQKKALYDAIKQLPDDGFDWEISWGVEYAIGNQFLEGMRKASDPRTVYKQWGMPAPEGLPPTQQDIDRYGEYMLAAQAALREHPDIATSLLNDLEPRERSLREVVQLLIPSPSGCNRARIRVHSDRLQLEHFPRSCGNVAPLSIVNEQTEQVEKKERFPASTCPVNAFRGDVRSRDSWRERAISLIENGLSGEMSVIRMFQRLLNHKQVGVADRGYRF